MMNAVYTTLALLSLFTWTYLHQAYNEYPAWDGQIYSPSTGESFNFEHGYYCNDEGHLMEKHPVFFWKDTDAFVRGFKPPHTCYITAIGKPSYGPIRL